MDKPAVIQIVGFKNRGKTTLVCRLVETLKKKGLRIGTIKHDAHDFEIDVPGKDTWQHREAGSETVAITSNTKTAIIDQRPHSVADLLVHMQSLDLVLIEGFKQGPYPKVVLVKEKEDLKLINELEYVIGAAYWSDDWKPNDGSKMWDIDDVELMANRLLDEVGLR